MRFKVHQSTKTLTPQLLTPLCSQGAINFIIAIGSIRRRSVAMPEAIGGDRGDRVVIEINRGRSGKVGGDQCE